MYLDSTEVWKDIQGYEDKYQISNQGRVKSLTRIVKQWNGNSWCCRKLKERFLKFGINNGYSYVALLENKIYMQIAVHRLVLLHFVGPCPTDMEACHFDGDRSNNNLNNLRWDTRLNNHKDRHKHGTTPRGTRNKSAKLNEDQIKQIRLECNRKLPRKVIAEKYGIASSTVGDIRSGRSWSHVICGRS